MSQKLVTFVGIGIIAAWMFGLQSKDYTFADDQLYDVRNSSAPQATLRPQFTLQADGKKKPNDFLQRFSEVIAIRESKPVRVNDIELVAVAQANWQPARPESHMLLFTPLEIQLRVVNRGKRDLFIPIDGFAIELTDADGKILKEGKVKKDNVRARGIVLGADSSYACRTRAGLRKDWNNSCELFYLDGTGSETILGPIAPGPYKLRLKPCTAAPEKGKRNGLGAAIPVSEEFTTESLLIEVDNSEIRGLAEDPHQIINGFDGPRRMHQSRPVTANGASFSIIAEADWPISTDSRNRVPVDIQLHLTNAGHSDTLFTTFDFFSLVCKASNGSVMTSSFSRDGMNVTKPVSLPKGASFSICRTAELIFDTDFKALQLLFRDGTGTGTLYGPFRTGGYRLAFSYGPRWKAPLFPSNALNDSRIWSGTVVTGDLNIEIRSLKGNEQR